MKIQCFKKLPQAAVEIRKAVFMDEQGFGYEFDKTDEKAIHIVAFDEGEPAGTCRVFEEDGTFYIGRLAVRRDLRGKHLGALLVGEAEQAAAGMGGEEIILHAQAQVREFYEKLGYAMFGEPDNEEEWPHVWMKKTLGQENEKS